MQITAYAYRTTQLRGVAILAVITIHILSSLPGYIFAQTGENVVWVTIDQAARFSVPLFVALSGYGLYSKYAETLSVRTFIQRRVLKLVPLYLLWTVGLALIFYIIPEWNSDVASTPFWKLIAFGSDYHLYFIPLIFQLYVLFPFLRNLFKKHAGVTVASAMLLQWLSYVFFDWHRKVYPDAVFSTDQAQYILPVSWIGYFVLGMFLSQHPIRFSKKHLLLLTSAWLLSLLTVSALAVQTISAGTDPLYALTFARPEVITYAVITCILALTIQIPKIALVRHVKHWIHFIGRYSFLLYISHTIVLRFIFAHALPGIETSQLILAALLCCIFVLISLQLENKN